MRAKCVTLDIDTDVTSSDLILLLRELGAQTESQRNPNLSFLLPNGTKFLDGSEAIDGVALTAESAAMRITFPKATPSAAGKKKPDAKKASGETKEETKTTGGATETTAGNLTPMTKPGATAVEKPDFLKTLWRNAEKEAEIREQIRENIYSLTPLMQRKDSFDGGTNLSVPPLLTPYMAASQGATPQGTPLNSPRNSTPPSLHSSRRSSFSGQFPDLFDGLGDTNAGETDTNNRINDIRKNATAAKIQGAWREYKENKAKEAETSKLGKIAKDGETGPNDETEKERKEKEEFKAVWFQFYNATGKLSKASL